MNFFKNKFFYLKCFLYNNVRTQYHILKNRIKNQFVKNVCFRRFKQLLETLAYITIKSLRSAVKIKVKSFEKKLLTKIKIFNMQVL